MAIITNSKFKIIVLGADGSHKLYPIAEFGGLHLQPGVKLGLVDAFTGKTPAGMTVKSTAKGWMLSLPELGQALEIAPGTLDQQTPWLSFVDLGALQPSLSSSGAAVQYAAASGADQPTTDAGAAGKTPDTFSLPDLDVGKAFSGMSGLVWAGLGLGLAAAAGVKGGGSGASLLPLSAAGTAIDGYLAGSTVSGKRIGQHRPYRRFRKIHRANRHRPHQSGGRGRCIHRPEIRGHLDSARWRDRRHPGDHHDPGHCRKRRICRRRSKGYRKGLGRTRRFGWLQHP